MQTLYQFNHNLYLNKMYVLVYISRASVALCAFDRPRLGVDISFLRGCDLRVVQNKCRT